MTMPFDTLKLARRLEAAGIAHQQAGDMSDAIAEAAANLATKDDLHALEQRLIIRLGGLNYARHRGSGGDQIFRLIR